MLACAAAAAVMAVLPAPAFAVERIQASFLSEYSAKSYVIDQGEVVTFSNSDHFLAHGVASDAAGLFEAPAIRRGAVRLLRGAPYLTTGGPYPFHCPIHPGMTASLSVTAAGAPLPPDGIPPAASVKLKTSKLSKLLKQRRLRVVVRVYEPVDLAIGAGVGGVSLGRLERTYVAPGARALSFRLPGSAARRLSGLFARGGPVGGKLKLSLSDAAGNRAAVKRRLRLAAPRRRPPKRGGG